MASIHTGDFGVPADTGSGLDSVIAYFVSKGLSWEMMWGDVGNLYFCITEQDLAARDFGRICFSAMGA